MNIISLLDCAFSFYQNYPCRLSHTELQWDFPCQETIFASEHPFAEPGFQVSRGLTLGEAFSSLFEENSGAEPSAVPDTIANLEVLDMFVLIHGTYHPISCFPFQQTNKSSVICLHQHAHDLPSTSPPQPYTQTVPHLNRIRKTTTIRQPRRLDTHPHPHGINTMARPLVDTAQHRITA
jgi:hypothetical protein